MLRDDSALNVRWKTSKTSEVTGGVLKKRNSPTITMDVGQTSTSLKARKRKADVGRYVAVHAEKLTHDSRIRTDRRFSISTNAPTSLIPEESSRPFY